MAWVEKRPTSLESFLCGGGGACVEHLLESPDSDTWCHLFHKGLISDVMCRLTLVFAKSQCGLLVNLIQHFKRAERLYAIRNGYATYTNILVGFDLMWRQNLAEKSKYYDSVLDFDTISAFSAVGDLILMDEEYYQPEYNGYMCQCQYSSKCFEYRPWLSVLYETRTINKLEFRELSKGFSKIATEDEWNRPVFFHLNIFQNDARISRVDSGDLVDRDDPPYEDEDETEVNPLYGKCIGPLALLVARDACEKAMRLRRIQTRMLVISVLLATYREVREKRYVPGGRGFEEASDRFAKMQKQC